MALRRAAAGAPWAAQRLAGGSKRPRPRSAAASAAHRQASSSILRPRYGFWVEGEEREAREHLPLRSPATGELMTEVGLASAEDVEAAVAAAQSSFEAGDWARMDANGRSRVLAGVARGIEARLPELAAMESVQTGRAIREMRAQLGRLPEWFDYFAALVRTREDSVPPFVGPYLNYTRRVPLGVCGLITPWNHPLLIAIKKIAPALAAGNSVVVKPPELAPAAVLELGPIAAEAGLPPGVLNILPGTGPVAGAALASHPLVRKVDVTGGTETGRLAAAAAGRNLARVTMELGGKAPMLVFADAPIQPTVDMCAFAAFVAAGQTCVSGARLLVQAAAFEEVAAKFVAKAEGIALGDPMDPRTQLGPLVSHRQRDRVDAYVQSARAEGATVLCGGRPPTDLPPRLAGGAFYLPTVIGDVAPGMRVWREEVFGPVVCIHRFEDEAEAVALANDSPYGLGAAVHTRDVRRAHRVAEALRAGVCWVNDHHRNAPSSPWGGVTPASGIGRENGLEALAAYSQSKSVVVGYAPDGKGFDWFAAPDAAAGGKPMRYS